MSTSPLKRKRSNPRRVLVREDNLETGEQGFLAKEAPRGFAPVLTLGHDLLEHQPRDTNVLTDELMALGAILYLRYFEGDRRQHRTGMRPMVDARDAASNLLNMFFRDVMKFSGGEVIGGYDDVQSYPIGKLYSPPYAKPLPMQDEIVEVANAEYKSSSGNYIEAEQSLREDNGETFDEDLGSECDKQWPRYLEAALAWMAFGMERAKRRYGGTPPQSYVRLYEMLDMATKELSERHADYFPAGHEVIVEYTVTPPSVSAWYKGAKRETLVQY